MSSLLVIIDVRTRSLHVLNDEMCGDIVLMTVAAQDLDDFFPNSDFILLIS